MSHHVNMAKPMDLELKKAFTDLQVKMVETNKKIKVIDAQIEKVIQNWHYVTVSRREIAGLPPGTKTYESVNRMFLLTDVNNIVNTFNERDAKLMDRIKELKNNKKYLEKNLKESGDNIREMVQQRKEQSEAA